MTITENMAVLARSATTVPTAASDPAPGANLIINGGMTVSQRGTVTVAAGAGPVYSACDRFLVNADTGLAAVTTTQDSTVLSGVGNSLKVDCTTIDASIAAADYMTIEQRIEAHQLLHLLFGTASAKSTTLSFDYRSPKSGTHCVALIADDGSRSIVKEFTVAVADTFEHFEVTFPGDTAGTIDDNDGIGFRVCWPLVGGSTYQGTAGAWAAGHFHSTSNQQNLMDNTANNVFLDNVKLEVGSSATAFQHESYGDTLAKCRRYFERYNSDDGNSMTPFHGQTSTTTRGLVTVFWSEKRTTPSITKTDADWQISTRGTWGTNVTAITVGHLSPRHCRFDCTMAANNAGEGCTLVSDSATVRYIDISAEL